MPKPARPITPAMARQNAAAALAARTGELGFLPEWDLSHLYPGMESEPFRADLARAEDVRDEEARAQRVAAHGRGFVRAGEVAHGRSGVGRRRVPRVGTRESGLGTRDPGVGTRDSGLGTRD